MNGGLITNNVSTNKSGGGVMAHGEFIMNGGEISNNTALKQYGGAIAVSKAGKLELNGGVISNNQALQAGGIYIEKSDNDYTSVISNVSFEDNIGNSAGGAIASYNKIDISNSIFNNNEAIEGGAIFLRNPITKASTITKSSFNNNSAKFGGAIENWNSILNISESTFKENNASSNGGAIYAYNLATVNISKNTRFEKNEAASMGGAIYTFDLSYDDPVDTSKYQNITVDNSTDFINNKAKSLHKAPQNVDDLSNIKFKSTSIDNINLGHKKHILNNYDLNYESASTDTILMNVKYYNSTEELLTDKTSNEVEYKIKSSTDFNLSKEHYNFSSWNTELDGSGTAYLANEVTQVTHDLNLYAQWDKEMYTLNFDSKGGSLVDKQSVEYEALFITPKDPTRENFKFSGWYTDEEYSNLYDFSTQATKDLTVYAKWEKIEESTVPKTGVNDSTLRNVVILNSALLLLTISIKKKRKLS